jgi:hypothetical protein
MRAHGPDVTAGLGRFLAPSSKSSRGHLWRSSARARNDSAVVAVLSARAGAAAVGALAFGALAIGALAVRSLFIGRARVRLVKIDRLVVDHLIVRNGDGARALEPIDPGATDDEDVVGDRASRTNGSAIHTASAQLSPGDEAAPGTPGTGEQSCPVCGGSGLVDAQRCQNCAGTGKVTHAIGGG